MADKNSFLGQINRLRDQFGDRAYGKEKTELIWHEVKHIPDKNIRDMIDDFIADSKFAPTRKEFREDIANRRLKNYQTEKTQRSDDVKKNFLSPENFQLGMKFVGKILQGGYSTEQVETAFKNMKTIPTACKYCRDEGIVFADEIGTKYEDFCFKCSCPAGRERTEAYPVWGREYFDKFRLT